MVILTAPQITQRVKDMGAQISRDLQHLDPIVILVVLKGGFIFAADLVRALDCDLRRRAKVQFVTVSSYDHSQTPLHNPRVEFHGGWDSLKAHVLVVDDVMDTGQTYRILERILIHKGAASVRPAVLAFKPQSLTLGLPEPEYYGIGVHLGKFLIGYGMDYCDRHRAHPDLLAINKEEYQDGEPTELARP